MPVKQITPNQFLNIKNEQIIFSCGCILLLLGFILFIVFVSNIKYETTNDGEKVYLNNPKGVLYASLVFTIFSFGLFGYMLYNYIRIFGASKSRMLYILATMLVATFILFILDIVYIAKKFNFCPDLQEFNKDLNKCVPICKDGNYIDKEGNCVKGCQTADDCGPGEFDCINNLCCDLTKNEKIDNQCCPENSVHDLPDGKGKYCCSQEICVGKNGKKICCDEPSLTCQVDDKSGDPYCAVKCGDEDICKKDEYCLSYPASLDDPTKSGKSFSCQSGDSCTTDNQPIYNPAAESNFYPAFNNEIDGTKPPLEDFLDNKPGTDKYNTVINAYQNDAQNNNMGFIAGLQNAIQFQTNSYKNCNSVETCLSNVLYPYTTQLNVVKDGNTLYCNQYQTFEKTMELKDDNTDKSYSKIKTKQDTNGIVTLDENNIDFATTPKPQENNLKDSNVCGKRNFYSSDISDFDNCEGSQCPFPDAEKSAIICPTSDNVKSIEKKPPTKSKCILGQDGNFACTPTEESRYDNYPSCGSDCNDMIGNMSNKASNYKLPDNCVTGETKWDDNKPHAGIVQMKYGNCGGGYSVGGSCDLKQHFTDDINNYALACPKGTKPFFYANKFDTAHDKLCAGAHKPILSNIKYVCCDEDNFKISDDDFPEPSSPPKNKSFCFGTEYIVGGSNDNSVPSSILIGRDGHGGSNDPTTDHDGCDVDEHKSFDKLKRLLGNANDNTWRGNSDKC